MNSSRNLTFTICALLLTFMILSVSGLELLRGVPVAQQSLAYWLIMAGVGGLAYSAFRLNDDHEQPRASSRWRGARLQSFLMLSLVVLALVNAVRLWLDSQGISIPVPWYWPEFY